MRAAVAAFALLLSAAAGALPIGPRNPANPALPWSPLSQYPAHAALAPVTVHHGIYQRAREPWQGRSRIAIRRDFTPELQQSVGDLWLLRP